MTENVIDQVASVLNAPEPVVPAVPESQEPKTVTLTQERLDGIIKERMGAAGKAAREEAARLKVENERLQALAVGNAPDASEVEKLRAEIALESQRASAAEARAAKQEKAVLQSHLGAAINAVDTESVSKLLADRLDTRDGKVVVVDESGIEQTNSDGTPTTPEQLYKSWAEAHPWAIRGSVVSGTGSSGSGNSIPPPTKPLSHYFGPHSNAADANRLSLRDPQTYK